MAQAVAPSLWALVVVGGALGDVPCSYSVEILPNIPCPGPLFDVGVLGQAVNNAGVVAGYYLDTCTFGDLIDEGFTWTPETGIVTIPRPPGVTSLQAFDISDNGLVVGRHSITGNGLGSLAFIYDGRRLTSLGTLPEGTYSQAAAVSPLGQIVAGQWGNNLTGIPTAVGAFTWSEGRMHNLWAELGAPLSGATDVNSFGIVTGWMSEKDLSQMHAYVWHRGATTVLPFVPGGFTSEGIAVSDDGWVAGHGLVEIAPGDFVLRPFVWDGKRMIPIDHLPGVTSSRVTGMNNDHQVIGYGVAGAIAETQTGAFFWSDGVTYDIGDFIRRDGYVLTKPWGINDHGDMAMTGAFDGRGVAAVVRPVARRFADLNCDGAVDLGDIQLLIAAWGVCEDSRCPADLDDSGIVNGYDLAFLLSSWSSS